MLSPVLCATSPMTLAAPSVLQALPPPLHNKAPVPAERLIAVDLLFFMMIKCPSRSGVDGRAMVDGPIPSVTSITRSVVLIAYNELPVGTVNLYRKLPWISAVACADWLLLPMVSQPLSFSNIPWLPEVRKERAAER